jgi:hypothetical protein
MDILTAIIDFLNVTDNSHYIKKDIKKLLDKNEYLGSRILSFLSLFITLIAIVFIIYIIYLIIKQKI